MKKYAVMLGLLAIAAGVFASDITIHDMTFNSNLFGTDTRPGVYEDQEVETGCIATQAWDLEAFTLSDDNKLGMKGGYNFLTKDYYGTQGGDIFISVGGDIPSTYEYAIDLAFNTQSGEYEYSVFKLEDDYILSECTDVSRSNPWQLASGGMLEYSGKFTYSTKYDGQGKHYIIDGIDLSFLNGQEFYSHYTMSCGNDNMLGHGTTTAVPEPGSLILFGTGLLGLIGFAFGRRKK